MYNRIVKEKRKAQEHGYDHHMGKKTKKGMYFPPLLNAIAAEELKECVVQGLRSIHIFQLSALQLQKLKMLRKC